MKSRAAKISLREKKHARTKVLLALEFVDRLKKADYDSVSVKDICEKAEVSEGTFYNYFPQKTEILSYIMSLYYRKIVLETEKKAVKEDPLRWVEIFFDNMVRIMVKDLGPLSSEIFAVIIKKSFLPMKLNVSKLEFCYMFPDVGEINEFRNKDDADYIGEIVEKVMEKGVLKKGVKASDVGAFFDMLIGSIPLMTVIHGKRQVSGIIKKQLYFFLRGVVK